MRANLDLTGGRRALRAAVVSARRRAGARRRQGDPGPGERPGRSRSARSSPERFPADELERALDPLDLPRRGDGVRRPGTGARESARHDAPAAPPRRPRTAPPSSSSRTRSGRHSSCGTSRPRRCADRFRVLRYDHRGQGGSEVPPGPYSLPMLAADLTSLLDELGIAQVSFVGLSLGGAVGMQFAVAYPERLDRLVLACTSARFGSPESWLERAALVRRAGIGAARRAGARPVVHRRRLGATPSPAAGRCSRRRRSRATPPAARRWPTGTSARSSATIQRADARARRRRGSRDAARARRGDRGRCRRAARGARGRLAPGERRAAGGVQRGRSGTLTSEVAA